jgi:glutamyl-tRNA reductase
MQHNNISISKTFYAIGLSYKKADAETRGRFSLDKTLKAKLLESAKVAGVTNLIVTSTCNRTELYGFAEHPFQLIKHLCENTSGTVEEFQRVAYVYKNRDAISHMFRVGTGLDSQILGDFEIISQLKASFNQSKAIGIVDGFLERLVNAVIQASKRIKNETEISTGATSVSFASVKYMLDHVEHISTKNILLFGTGKIGRNTCENLIKHTTNKHITLINRTKDKAERIAGKFDLLVKDYKDLPSEIRKSDIIIVATGAQTPTLDRSIITTDKPLLILDLSIPKNVADDVKQLPNVALVHLDDLSQITDETIEKRKAYIPKAEAIIEEVKDEFSAWIETRKFAPTIKALKSKLQQIKSEEIDFQKRKAHNFNESQAEVLSNRIIQKITKHFANHLKDSNGNTDESIAVISKVFLLEAAENE